MCTISNFFDIDSFTMSDASASATPVAEPTPAPSIPPPPLGEGGPFSGVPIVLPGVIEAEEFDLGGEGVAYSDTTTGNMKGVRGRERLRVSEHLLAKPCGASCVSIQYLTHG